jgi:hypothetical protein
VNSKRLRLVLIALIALGAVLFVAICILGLSKLEEKSKEVVEWKLKSRTVEAQQANFAQAKIDVEKYGYFKQVAKTVIPADKDQAQAVLDIFQLADQSGIALQSVTFAASTLGAKPTSTGSASSAATTQAALSQAQPVEGIKGLYSLELTITPDLGAQVPANKRATYAKLLDFLQRIERNRRTAQISQVTVQPQTDTSGNSQSINFSLTTSIFIKP